MVASFQNNAYILYQLVQIQTKLECDQDVFKVFSALCLFISR